MFRFHYFLLIVYFTLLALSSCETKPCLDDPTAKCSNFKDRCTDPNLIPLLQDACPVTCNLCPTTLAPTTEKPCEDDKNTDCVSLKSDCNNPKYYSLLNEFCPLTCGFCKSQCMDDPRTDCTSMISDCSNPIYIPLLKEYCPVTCNLCSVTLTTKTVHPTIVARTTRALTTAPRTTTISQRTTTTAVCEDDKNTDCAGNKGLCDNPKYPMMKTFCPVTCNLCGERTRGQTANPTDSSCYDSTPKCKEWAANGYCHQCIYTCEERISNCAKTCGFCQKGVCREC
ncbi:unnamed protein product [Caenorhabditis brenneri]